MVLGYSVIFFCFALLSDVKLRRHVGALLVHMVYDGVLALNEECLNFMPQRLLLAWQKNKNT